MILLQISFYFSTYLENQKEFPILENRNSSLGAGIQIMIRFSKLKHDIFFA